MVPPLSLLTSGTEVVVSSVDVGAGSSWLELLVEGAEVEVGSGVSDETVEDGAVGVQEPLGAGGGVHDGVQVEVLSGVQTGAEVEVGAGGGVHDGVLSVVDVGVQDCSLTSPEVGVAGEVVEDEVEVDVDRVRDVVVVLVLDVLVGVQVCGEGTSWAS